MTTDIAELERAIVDNPDDIAAYQVYADHLTTRGDPRGELIALQLAAERRPDDKKLSRAIAAVVEQHPALFAPFREDIGLFDDPAVTWSRGFVRRIELDQAGMLPRTLHEKLARGLEHPSCRLVREIALRDVRGQPEPLLDALAVIGERAPRALTAVELTGSHDIGDLRSLEAIALRRLSIRVDYEADGPVSPSTIRAIARSPWPLERLQLHLANGVTTCDALEPLLRAELPHLTHLRLRTVVHALRWQGSTFALDLVRALVTSPFAPRLLVLELTCGDLDEAVAEYLAANAACFPRLRELWVLRPYPVLARLAKHVVPVVDRVDNTITIPQ